MQEALGKVVGRCTSHRTFGGTCCAVLIETDESTRMRTDSSRSPPAGGGVGICADLHMSVGIPLKTKRIKKADALSLNCDVSPPGGRKLRCSFLKRPNLSRHKYKENPDCLLLSDARYHI